MKTKTSAPLSTNARTRATSDPKSIEKITFDNAKSQHVHTLSSLFFHEIIGYFLT